MYLILSCSLQNQEVQVDYYIYRCNSTIYYTMFIVTAVLYKFILHVIGLVLAWLTRKVEIDVLNDYKSTVAIVICSSILLVAICIILPNIITSTFEYYIAWSMLAFMIAVIHLGFTFIPKVSLYSYYNSSYHILIIVCSSLQRSTRTQYF